VKFYLHKKFILKISKKYLAILMGYNIEISVNLRKHSKFSEIESIIQENAELFGSESIYSISEEDGASKIPRYHCIFIINFLDENIENFVKFIKIIKKNKLGYIECIYNNNICNSKLVYASSYYLNNIDKEISIKYKKFINDKKYTINENKLIKEFIKSI